MATSNLGFQSFYQTELTSNISSTDTDIPLASLPTPSEGYLVIESTVPAKREIIYYTSKGTGKVICPSAAAGRGVDGTTAVSHSSGAGVIMAPVGKMFADLQNGTALGTAAVNTANLAFGFTGLMLPYAGSSAPTGWLICDGSTVSRTTYADLFAIVSTTYGAGDGSTTFTLPDMRGRMPVGRKSTDTDFQTLGQTGGQKTVQAHTHNAPTSTGVAGTVYEVPLTQYAGYDYIGAAPTSSTGSGTTNMNPYLVINYIIKT